MTGEPPIIVRRRHGFLRRLRSALWFRLKNGIHPYRQWKFRGIERRFRARSLHEAYHIVYRIILEDEYHIAHQRFAPSDVIIDIGAHIGVFSYMAQVQGSRNIHAFEADSENYALLKKNLQDLPGIHAHHQAVGRSDAGAQSEVMHSGYILDNTGGGNVIMRGRPFEFCRQEFFSRPPTASSRRISSVRLDDVLAPFEAVKLLKIDCEGSEFPILLTSRLLSRVERIVGEYHEIEPQMMSYLDPGAAIPGYTQYRIAELAEVLQAHGFRVTFREANRCIGAFDATRD